MAYYEAQPAGFLTSERRKARDLKKTSWWKLQLMRGECYYCMGKFDLQNLTMDHKVPLARGGKSTKSNTVVACKDCNSQKKTKTPAELIMDKLNLYK